MSRGYIIFNSWVRAFNRPFPSSPRPLFQNEGRCSAFDMDIHSCAPSLILKARVFGTRKWPMPYVNPAFLNSRVKLSSE